MSMFDTFKIMSKLSEAKDKLKDIKEKLPFVGVTEQSEDGLIKVAISGDRVIKTLEINENMLYPAAKKDLEEKLIIVLNTAIKEAEKIYKDELKKGMEGMFPEIPGFDLSNLPL